MARNIFVVNATQVVTSDSHPEGLFSVVSGYPKTFDSRSYPAADGNRDAGNRTGTHRDAGEHRCVPRHDSCAGTGT